MQSSLSVNCQFAEEIDVKGADCSSRRSLSPSSAAIEIENLKKEASAFREVKKNLSEPGGPQKVFEKDRRRFTPRDFPSSSPH